MAGFTFKLEQEDETPADPLVLHTAVPNWSAGGRRMSQVASARTVVSTTAGSAATATTPSRFARPVPTRGSSCDCASAAQ
jgi:hypothetical protein